LRAARQKTSIDNTRTDQNLGIQIDVEYIAGLAEAGV
jgi:hypothetical protein